MKYTEKIGDSYVTFEGKDIKRYAPKSLFECFTSSFRLTFITLLIFGAWWLLSEFCDFLF